MNNGKQSTWSVFWGGAVVVALAGLPFAFASPDPRDGCVILIFLILAVLMLALPSMWECWKRGRPQRERVRAAARERAAENVRSREEQEEARHQRRVDQANRREAKAAQARGRQQAAAARQEAETYYRANAALLGGVLPAALFRAEVESAFPSGTASEAAWQAARDLIARMQPLVRQEQERLRQEEEREVRRAEQVRELDKQIRGHEARIRALQRSAREADFVEDEVAAERQIIEQLREEREMLQHAR